MKAAKEMHRKVQVLQRAHRDRHDVRSKRSFCILGHAYACVQAVHTALAACSQAVADEWLDFLEGVTKVLRTKNRLVF